MAGRNCQLLHWPDTTFLSSGGIPGFSDIMTIWRILLEPAGFRRLQAVTLNAPMGAGRDGWFGALTANQCSTLSLFLHTLGFHQPVATSFGNLLQTTLLSPWGSPVLDIRCAVVRCRLLKPSAESFAAASNPSSAPFLSI